MKHYKDVEIPAKVEKLVVRTTCDLCGDDKRGRNSWRDSSIYSIDSTRVLHEQGESYPECESKTSTEFDICSSCFETKLVPWLREQGAEPRVNSVDW